MLKPDYSFCQIGKTSFTAPIPVRNAILGKSNIIGGIFWWKEYYEIILKAGWDENC